MAAVFLRTGSGITNFHRFTSSDFIAYCEGGEGNFSAADVLSGAANISSEDISFWRAMCAHFAPEVKVHFKPIGSCRNLVGMISDIRSKNAKNVAVFLDRDWRNYTGNIEKDNFVVYTFNYSWENDVVKAENVAHAAVDLAHIGSHCIPEIQGMFCELTESLGISLKGPFRRQIESFGSGAVFVPTDYKLGGALEEADGLCRVNRSRLADIYRTAKKRYERRRDAPGVRGFHLGNCPGHVLMGLASLLIRAYLKKIGIRKPLYDADIRAMIIREFRDSASRYMTMDEVCYYRTAIGRALSVI